MKNSLWEFSMRIALKTVLRMDSRVIPMLRHSRRAGWKPVWVRKRVWSGERNLTGKDVTETSKAELSSREGVSSSKTSKEIQQGQYWWAASSSRGRREIKEAPGMVFSYVMSWRSGRRFSRAQETAGYRRQAQEGGLLNQTTWFKSYCCHLLKG